MFFDFQYSRYELVVNFNNMTTHLSKIYDILNENIESKLIDSPRIFDENIIIHEISGRSIQWFRLEVYVYVIFLVTMMFMLMKARFFKIRQEQEHQFYPPFLCLMANKIVRKIDFDLDEKVRSLQQTKKYFVNSVRHIHCAE